MALRLHSQVSRLMRSNLFTKPRHNYRAALDAATALCLPVGRQWRGASERER